LERYKFRRQQPIGRYIVDFVCFEAGLVLELDGGQHADQAAADLDRTRWLESQGFKVLRFWNNELLGNPEGTLQAIQSALSTPHPLAAARDLSHKGRG